MTDEELLDKLQDPQSRLEILLYLIYETLGSGGGGTANHNILLNKPNLWEVGKEYDFGDGVYGQRFTGRITVNAKVGSDVILTDSISNVNPVSIGGWIAWDSNDGSKTNRVPINTAEGNNSSPIEAILYFNDAAGANGIHLHSYSFRNRTNAPYDIWILYTKASS